MKAFFTVKQNLLSVAIVALLHVNLPTFVKAEVVIQPSGAAQVALVEKIDPEVLRTEGEALVYAIDPALRDVGNGMDLLEQSAAAGNVKAMLSLGSLYLYGAAIPRNRARALTYFEQAAAAGDASGLAQYGMMLMWSEADWSHAQKILVRAGETGDAGAWATLAEGAMYGYLGGGRYSRAKFDGFAEKARAAGNTRIEVLDAKRQMWGISMRADGPAAVAKLRAAADKGNVEAAKYLISILRDGNDMNIARDRAAATEAVGHYSNLLTKTEIWQYNLSIDAALASNKSSYTSITAEITAHPEWITTPLAVEVQKANPRVAMYVLQQRLKAKGLYHGPVDGLAGKKTLRAMHSACDGLWDRSGCDDNVLRPAVVAALISMTR
ncbi:MAG: hypothetical protein ABIQ90_14920 [Polaromonas sp.]